MGIELEFHIIGIELEFHIMGIELEFHIIFSARPLRCWDITQVWEADASFLLKNVSWNEYTSAEGLGGCILLFLYLFLLIFG